MTLGLAALLPTWLHETLALTGVGLAAIWLIVRLVQIGRPRASGCARCEHAIEALPAHTSPPTRAVRSERLRVIE